MTYRKLCKILEDAGIEDSGLEASILISHFCGAPRESLFLRRDEDFGSESLENAVRLRCTRYPLQYIIGEWEFCTETYKVGEGCLIPRPETEFMVEYAASHLKKDSFFLDLCTGSGCIAVSTLVRRTDCTCLGVDVSDAALSYAKENASLNGVSERLDFLKCDLLGVNAAKTVCEGKKISAILSNPPYIPSDVVQTLEKELFAEPQNALDGGLDGLVFYRHIVREFAPYLENDGFFLFEIGDTQGDDLRRVAEENGFKFKLVLDLAGKERNVILTR